MQSLQRPPGNYHYVSYNCTDYSEQLLGAAGIDFRSNWTNQSTPLGQAIDVYMQNIKDNIVDFANYILYLQDLLTEDFNNTSNEIIYSVYLLHISGDMSPLVLDLDGDGIETRPASHKVMFDLDADGYGDPSGWVKSDDALLVFDRNGNGIIDNGKELFGSETQMSNGQTPIFGFGFEALADLDSNDDGVITAADANFSELQLWQDFNQDGTSQANELISLDEAGIASLALGFTTSNAVDHKNKLALNGSFTWSDGSVGEMTDVFFDTLDSTQNTNQSTSQASLIGQSGSADNESVVSDFFW